jgi:hypothetical protein
MVDLAGIIKNINMGKNGVMPSDPMKVGVDLLIAPYVFLGMLGEFKGEMGIRHHIVALASYTMSGIDLRLWIKTLISI